LSFLKNFFFISLNKPASFFFKFKIKYLNIHFFRFSILSKNDFYETNDTYFLENFIFLKKFYTVADNFYKYWIFSKKHIFNIFFYKKNYKFFHKVGFYKKNNKNLNNVQNLDISKIIINFKPDLVAKDLTDTNYLNSFFFLRKTKIFNKGRYSRNRQLYRTGVYLCLYINILAIYAIYFLFYRFTFNFGYFWIFLFFTVFSFFFFCFFLFNFFF